VCIILRTEFVSPTSIQTRMALKFIGRPIHFRDVTMLCIVAKSIQAITAG